MYSNGDDLTWFNYTFMTYKDMSYGTDGYLRLSGSTSTSNFQNFSAFKLQLSISNKIQKSCSLGLAEIIDLTSAFDKVKTLFKTSGFSESVIERKVGKSINLIIQFFMDSNTKELLVKIELYSNDTDFTRVILPLQFEFFALTKIFRQYIDSVFMVGIQFMSSSFNSVHLGKIPDILKTIPSGIISRITAPEEETVSEEVIKGAVETQATIDDLDKFMGPNMENVVVPDEVKQAIDYDKPKVEIKSEYVEKILKNDLSNLETFLNNIVLTPAPILEVVKEVSVLGDDFDPLIGISEDEKKSLLYMTKIYYSVSYNSYMDHRVTLPQATPVFKYKPSNIKDMNLELAYDLFLISLYVRAVRRKLENADSDAIMNCSLFHMQIRCFLDPFIFSFLDKVEPKNLQSICVQRFKVFDENGVFDKYKSRLEENGCSQVNSEEILDSIIEASTKVIGKAPDIIELHENAFRKNSLVLSTQNNFTIEQIINEFIPLELAEKMGRDLNDKELISELKERYNISDEVINFFKKGRKTQPKVSKVKKISNLTRICNHFRDEIPAECRDSFLSYIDELKEKKFEFVSSSFPLRDFGENVIKALYVWDPESDPKVVSNYKHFFLKVEEEVMEKDLILTKVGDEIFEGKTDDGWGEIVTNGV